ncbi:MAG TPA: DUF1700 domain-containing protein [Ramlibacter sp.]|nr:DUF1700 domain-containing protein [Ramlibacter sp.]
MGRLEYIDALKRALAGLPPDTVARTLAYYEQRFIDGLAAGRSEDEVSEDLGDPKKIAMTLRANVHREALEPKKRKAGVLRMGATAVGLAVFNLFMVVPAAVFAALLASIYALSFALYLGGIAVTASGLAGANEIVFSSPNVHYEDGREVRSDGATRLTIGHDGVQVHRERGMDVDGDADAQAPSKVIRHEETVAGRGIRVYTDLDTHSRTTQSLVGLAMVAGGILVFLLCLVVSNYAFIGLRRYIDMNLSLVRGG